MNDNLFWQNQGQYVREGLLVAMPLSFPGQSVPPPAGETAMTALAVDPMGTIYCGTTGAKAHVLAAMIHEDTGIVFDRGEVPGAASIDGLFLDADNLCIVASGSGASSLWSLPRYRQTFLIQEWFLARPPYERVCDLFTDRHVAHAVAAREGRACFGITDPHGEVFRLALHSRKPEILGQVDKDGRFARRLVLDRVGGLWGTAGASELWTYNPNVTTGPEKTGLQVPGAAGRAQHTQVSAWAVDPLTGLLYGGTEPDGFLFKLDPHTRHLTPLGKPARQGPITCLTVGNDGRVFGMAGDADDIGHLFVYDPRHGSLTDLGIPLSTLNARQYGYHFRAAVTGHHGEIYFGQHERVNHLWIYFPPIPKRPPIQD